MIEQDKLLANAVTVGELIRDGMARELAGVKGFVGLRGQGLMIGIELDKPCAALLNQALERGLLMSVTAEKVVRLVPPLILSQQEADEIVSILVPLIKEFLAA